jgi:hypothetical protein
MTNGILTSRREKICLCNISLNFPSLHNKEKFKSFRNTYNKVIRAVKKLFYENELIKHQSNLKKTWQTIKLAINKNAKKSASISSLLVNNIYITDSRVMADHFNEFFTNIPAKIVREINPVNTSDIPHFARNFFESEEGEGDVQLFSFSTNPLTAQDIVEATNCLQPKFSQDMCGFSLHFIKLQKSHFYNFFKDFKISFHFKISEKYFVSKSP